MPSRTEYTLKNAKVGALCYFASLLVSFFSRRIFLEQLGADFLGFTGTLASILGFLNIAEFGISSAISIVLYKPLFEKDQQQITQITSVLGYLYRCVGFFILSAGVITALILPFIFTDFPFSFWVLYIGFFSFLFSSLLGYFINYGTILLSADQRNYVVSGYFQLVYSVKVILQCLIAVWLQNYYLFFALEILFSIVYSVILQYKLHQCYPWLKTSVRDGKNLLVQYPEVRQKVAQIAIHKLGGFIQNQSAPLFILGFVSLPMVALYNNYSLVCGSIKMLLYKVLESSSASVGNLIAEGDETKIYESYKELLTLRFVCAGIVSGCVFYLLPSFITLWLGAQYLLPQSVTILVALHLFLTLFRDTTDQFLTGYGLIQDVFSPVVESAIFIIASLIGGYYWGLSGVLWGSLSSLILVIYTWKPYFLYTRGFNRPVTQYILFFSKHLLLQGASLYFTYCLVQLLLSKIQVFEEPTWIGWILTAVVFTTMFVVLVFVSFYLFSKPFRTLLHRFSSRNLLS